MRIHVSGGLVRLPSGKVYKLQSIIGEVGQLLIKINGGNRKRGLMAWAMNCVPQNASGEGRAIARTLDPVVGQEE